MPLEARDQSKITLTFQQQQKRRKHEDEEHVPHNSLNNSSATAITEICQKEEFCRTRIPQINELEKFR